MQGSGAKVLSVVASMLGGRVVHRRRRPFVGRVCFGGGWRLWCRLLLLWGRGCGRSLSVMSASSDRALELALGRAWSVGAARATAEMTVDLDSTVCELFGKSKHGAAYGHTKVWAITR